MPEHHVYCMQTMCCTNVYTHACTYTPIKAKKDVRFFWHMGQNHLAIAWFAWEKNQKQQKKKKKKILVKIFFNFNCI